MAGHLLVATASFPYGNRTDFLEDEITYLARAFDRVTLLPEAPTGTRNEVPSHVDVDLSLAKTLGSLPGKATLSSRWGHRLALASGPGSLRSTLREAAAAGRPRIGAVGEVVLEEARRAAASRWAQHQTEPPDLAYTYWLSGLTLGLAETWPSVPVVARTHGQDLYAERWRGGRIPLRAETLKRVSYVACASDAGAAYLRQRYPVEASKILTRPLGVDGGPGICPPSEDGILRVISVAAAIPLKRIDLLGRALVALSSAGQLVDWTHLGGGPLLDELRITFAPRPGFATAFPGHLPIRAVMETLDSGPWDVMVSASSTEGGRPISLMEAMSRGIPLAATDVGGTQELFTSPLVGTLVGPNPTAAELARAIRDAALTPHSYRDERRRIWQESYAADRVYSHFARWLAGLAS